MKLPRVMLLICLCVSLTMPVQAQDFGEALKKTVERAAKKEVERKADEETRRVTRCALGSRECQSVEEPAQEPQVEQQSLSSAAFAIAPYQGSILREENIDAFNEYDRIIGFDREPLTETLEGRLSRRKYDNPAGRSTLEIAGNYKQALIGLGFVIDFSCAKRRECGNPAKQPSWQSLNGINLGVAGDIRYLTGHLIQSDRKLFAVVAINPQIHYIHTVEVGMMQGGMVSAATLADNLKRDGRVDLQGIYFDTGKAVLRPESAAALAEVAQLMTAMPDIRLAIVGHTDSTGKFEANMSLSQARAEAVRTALVTQYGIVAGRLEAQGKGSTASIASNDTPEGRAKNRRVELIRQ